MSLANIENQVAWNAAMLSAVLADGKASEAGPSAMGLGCMEHGAGGGWRNKVLIDGGPEESGDCGDDTRQAAVGAPSVAGDAGDKHGPQQFSRKRFTSTSIGSSGLRSGSDRVGD